MQIVFLGPPGAGKGTQAVMLADKKGFLHLSTGDILRENVKNGTLIGKKAKAFMDKGELVPDDIVIKIVVERFRSKDTTAGFILDGFPRTKPQAISLDKELGKIGIGIDYVIYFDTREETIISRLTGRRVCRNCGANYHTVNIKPKKDNICDRCGKELYQRNDDKLDTVKNRIKVYKEQTADLIDYYKSKDILKTVSGDLSVEAVFEELNGFFNRQGIIK